MPMVILHVAVARIVFELSSCCMQQIVPRQRLRGLFPIFIYLFQVFRKLSLLLHVVVCYLVILELGSSRLRCGCCPGMEGISGGRRSFCHNNKSCCLIRAKLQSELQKCASSALVSTPRFVGLTI